MASTFKINSCGIRTMLKSNIADAACMPHVEATLARAIAGAPVADGSYRASIHLQVEQHPQRKAFHIIADSPEAMLVEGDTGNLGKSL